LTYIGVRDDLVSLLFQVAVLNNSGTNFSDHHPNEVSSL